MIRRGLFTLWLVMSFFYFSSEPAGALCIGCGCERDYNRCLEGLNSSCILPQSDGFVIKECCTEQKTKCHRCDGGFVCFRLEAATGQTVDFSNLTIEQWTEVEPFLPIVDKFAADVTLTSFDYALIDGPATEIRKGMTWNKIEHNTTLGTDIVACNGCNPYEGDTNCSEERPLLCINKDGSRNPGARRRPWWRSTWAEGNIATTLPIQGAKLLSYEEASRICKESFGEGWRMAEFHDGGFGWEFDAYGNVRSSTRFWVFINDQSANCWN